MTFNVGPRIAWDTVCCDADPKKPDKLITVNIIKIGPKHNSVVNFHLFHL